MVFSLYYGLVGKCSYSQEMHDKVFRGELSSWLQITKWLPTMINSKVLKHVDRKKATTAVSEIVKGRWMFIVLYFNLHLVDTGWYFLHIAERFENRWLKPA